MKLKIFILTSILFICSLVNAQTIRNCASMHVLELQLAKNPGMKAKLDSNEHFYRQFSDKKNALRTQATTITIPVIVHVLYTQSLENISDAQIASQIAVLNKDYSSTNTDINKVPATFTSVVGNANIQFALATRDPLGQPTTGIHRVSTTKSSFDSDLDDAKFTSQGGTDAWPRDKYLNLWIVPAIDPPTNSTLGYASFPGGPANVDGVVIAYQYFGTTGTAKSPFNLGRTATHEVGHWLSLYHTFQDGCSGLSSGTCASLGDKVCDTPPTASANYQCPTTQNTCTENPDQSDMTMNYMDYVNDNCMFMFSAGQVTRIQATLNGSRSPIKTSDGLTNPNLVLDAGLSEIISPSESICTNSINPSIVVTNYGSTTITSMKINYTVDNNATESFTYTGSIVKNGNASILLPVKSNLTAGGHTYKVEINLVNGSSDNNALNNTQTNNFTIESITELPLAENFSNSNTLTTIWSIDNSDGGYTWEASNIKASKPHDFCLSINNYDYTGGNGQIDALISPPLSILASSKITFDVAYKLYTEITGIGDYSDTLQVLYSEDCGLNYKSLYKKAGLALSTGNPYFTTLKFIPTDNEWRTETIDISSLAGKNIILAFVNISDNENMLYLDEINVTSTTTGINDVIVKDNTLKIFPNPGKSDFTVISPQTIESLSISDITGREIFAAYPQTEQYQFHLANISAGIYLVKVNMQGEEKVLKLVVE